MELIWSDEDAQYVRNRSNRYPSALDIEPEWTQEAVDDEHCVKLNPYPRSRVGATGYIVAYVLVCVAAPVFLRRIGELTAGPAVVAGVSAVALTAALVAFLVVGTDAVALASVTAATLLAGAGIAIVAARPRSRPIGAYDEPVAAQVLGGVAPPGRTDA